MSKRRDSWSAGEGCTVSYGLSFSRQELTPRQIDVFQGIIHSWYTHHGRALPWRKTEDPYAIVVSEIMLQQTQVERVAGKFPPFLEAFPDFASLAAAPLKQVLQVWQGMGYNRRALALKHIAVKVMEEYDGVLPSDPDVLVTFPGIGKATAASICTFAWNRVIPFIETNVRTVYIHFFFPGEDIVADRELLPLVDVTLDRRDPRTWFNALMDYGVFLKQQLPDPGRRSSHYRKQPPFEGSNRKMRGEILRILTSGGSMSLEEIAATLCTSPADLQGNLEKLALEGFIGYVENKFEIAGHTTLEQAPPAFPH